VLVDPSSQTDLDLYKEAYKNKENDKKNPA
jgi:hypothetical protein